MSVALTLIGQKLYKNLGNSKTTQSYTDLVCQMNGFDKKCQNNYYTITVVKEN